MTKEQLEAIRGRAKGYVPSYAALQDDTWTLQSAIDRMALLAEVDRLTAENERLQIANTGLATEGERLRSGLRFYAHGQHMVGFEDWEDGADSECPSWCCPPDESSMMVEDGGCARMVLAGVDPDWDGEPPLEHPCEPVMQALFALEQKP